MEQQIFIIKVNPEKWRWNNEPNNWDDIKDGASVSFDGNCENRSDVNSIQMHDIFVGYNMDYPGKDRSKALVCVGRIISDGCFPSVGCQDDDNIRFLVQKAITMAKPLSRNWLLENGITTGINQHTVTKIADHDWGIIKKKLLSDEPSHEGMVKKLETTWNDINLSSI